jgi:hypothetical protein
LFVSGCGFTLSILTHYTCQNFSRISETISINSSRNSNDGNVRMEIYLAPSLNLVQNPVVSSWKSDSFNKKLGLPAKTDKQQGSSLCSSPKNSPIFLHAPLEKLPGHFTEIAAPSPPRQHIPTAMSICVICTSLHIVSKCINNKMTGMQTSISKESICLPNQPGVGDAPKLCLNISGSSIRGSCTHHR